MNTKNITVAAIALTAIAGAASGQIELTNNGGFESGDLSGWTSFPGPTSTFLLTGDASDGSFAAEIFNNDPAINALVKQANIGVGVVQPGDEVTISFDAKGQGAAGGIVFAEFFSELSGGGTSSAEILGGAPLALDPNNYTSFSFTATAGPDVSGGVTFQIGAVTGGDPASTSVLIFDNVSVSIIPAPGALAVLGLGGVAAIRRRR
ncbi:MAG: hypothetical protein AAF297_08185 [Planctomycetota bacterium]